MRTTYTNGSIEEAIRDWESGKALVFNAGSNAYGLVRKITVLAKVNFVSGDTVNATVAIKLPNGHRVRYRDAWYSISSLERTGFLPVCKTAQEGI